MDFRGVALCALLVPAMAFAAHSTSASNKTSSVNATDQAYKDSVHNLLPLSAKQIKDFRSRLKSTQKAVHQRKPAALHSASKVLRLEPGAPTPTIRITPGYVSDIVFLDQTGAPWPITSIALGDGSAFDVQHPNIKAKNLLTISAKGRHRDSDLSITLKGWATPIIVRLKTDPQKTNALTSFRADQKGPNATQQVVGPPVENTVGNTMMAFLDNVPPEKATSLNTHGGSGQPIQAWYYNHQLFVRTRQAAVWPAWKSVAKGAGGVRVYEMPQESYLMLSENGQTQTIQLSRAPSAHAENKGQSHGG